MYATPAIEGQAGLHSGGVTFWTFEHHPGLHSSECLLLCIKRLI